MRFVVLTALIGTIFAGLFMIPKKAEARGIRNNNPLNIKNTSIIWDGEIEGFDSTFETFKDPVYGIRAGAVLIRNYRRLYGLRSIIQILDRFAPSTENDTKAYALSVAGSMGVTVDYEPNLFDDAEIERLLVAMIKHENGYQPYSLSLIREGVKLA